MKYIHSIKIFIVHCIIVLTMYSALPSIANAQWQELHTSISEFQSLLFSGGALYAASSIGLYKSTDEGLGWVRCDSGIRHDNLGRKFVNSIIESGNTLLVSAFVDSGAVYRSPDGGNNWLKVDENKSLSKLTSIGSDVYECFPGGIIKSTDSGVRWSKTSDTTVSNMAFAVNNSFLFSSGTIGVYRSSDDGATWQITGLDNDFIISLTANDSVVYAGSDFGPVYKSTNNGVTWTKGDRDFLFNISLLIHGNDIYDGTDYGIFRSTDFGHHWVNISSVNSTHSLLNNVVNGIAVSNEHLFIIRNNNTELWSLPLSSLTEVKQESSVPSHWRLGQNFPNPFNPSTKIEFEIPERSYVQLKVYNLLGVEVTTLVDGMEEVGHKTVEFYKSGLPGGVYIYRLQSKNFMEAKKFLLIQ